MKKLWSEAIDYYLNHRKTLKLILLLLDIRRTANKEDLMFIEWAAHHGIPLLLVFTKCDKVKVSERKKQEQKNREVVKEKTGVASIESLSYSIKDNRGKSLLLRKIEETLWAE